MLKSCLRPDSGIDIEVLNYRLAFDRDAEYSLTNGAVEHLSEIEVDCVGAVSHRHVVAYGCAIAL